VITAANFAIAFILLYANCSCVTQRRAKLGPRQAAGRSRRGAEAVHWSDTNVSVHRQEFKPTRGDE